jgi:flagellar assembly factor FliW
MNRNLYPEKEPKGMTVDASAQRTMLAVRPENVFHFPEGLPAFEYAKDYVVLSKEDTRPFFFLQSLKPADLAFVCIDPFIVHPGYAPRISDNDVRLLQLEGPADLMLFSIVTVTRDYHDITTNLQAPLAINIRTNVGRQVLCDQQNYPMQFRIWDALSGANNSTAARLDAGVAHGVA